MTDVTASFGKPFKLQVAAFRLRLANLQGTTAWNDLWQSEHDRAFMVAGAMKADLLADLAAAVDKAVSTGTGIEEFRRDFRAIVEKNGWHGWTGEGSKGGEAWRTRVIYQTNLSTSYAAGRYAQLRAGKFAYWVYFHGASREPRLQHLGWNGLILPSDHPFWNTHYPPNGWGCSCFVAGARSLAGAVRLGGKADVKLQDGWQAPDPRTGAPVGIGKGWAYAPGATVAEPVSIAAAKIATLPPELGSSFGQALDREIERDWKLWVEAARSNPSIRPGFAGVLPHQVIGALETAGRRPISADVLVKPGLIFGRKAERHSVAGDALTPEQWLELPKLLRDPLAVAIDNRSGKLLFILKESGRVPQLAIELDQIVGKRADPSQLANLVVSAYRPKLADIVGRAVGGLISVIIGSLM